MPSVNKTPAFDKLLKYIKEVQELSYIPLYILWPKSELNKIDCELINDPGTTLTQQCDDSEILPSFNGIKIFPVEEM